MRLGLLVAALFGVACSGTLKETLGPTPQEQIEKERATNEELRAENARLKHDLAVCKGLAK